MKTAWVIVKPDGKTVMNRYDFGRVATLFFTYKGAKRFKYEGESIKRVRVNIP